MKIHESFTRRAYNCLNVLDHFVRLALKGLKSVTKSKNRKTNPRNISCWKVFLYALLLLGNTSYMQIFLCNFWTIFSGTIVLSRWTNTWKCSVILTALLRRHSHHKSLEELERNTWKSMVCCCRLDFHHCLEHRMIFSAL